MYKKFGLNFAFAMVRRFVYRFRQIFAIENINTIFTNICLNFDFLSKVKDNLHINLIKMVPTFNHFLCKTINRKYQNRFKFFFTGEELKYNLNVCLTNFEEHKIKCIMDQNLKVVI